MRLLAAPLLALLVLTSCIPASTPSATTSAPIDTVGPLYLPGLTTHYCTASVLKSPGHNLLLTAAHCVVGTGAGMRFVPGASAGGSPYGSWTVTSAYADPTWVLGQNPARDYALLVVAPAYVNGAWHHVEDLTGGNQLAAVPPPDLGRVRIPAYPEGSNDGPIDCANLTYATGTYPSFDCHGYVNGVSGAPWLRGSQSAPGGVTVLGTIGGLHQGGCFDYTSYSSPFDSATLALYARATSRGTPSVLPVPGPDGC